MCKLTSPVLAMAIALLHGTAAVSADTHRYGFGEAASAEQIAGWDIDVRPDGEGLPPGSGTVEQGEMLYEKKCASCHGSFGEGMGRWPILAGGVGSLTEDRPEKTVGSYWPFVSTLWDYIHRAMPFLRPQSLTDDEVYAITAYVLYLNDLVDDEFVLSRENLADIRLPNEPAFVDDPRPDVTNTRCMEGCRDPKSIRITWDSTNLGVTPVEHLQSSVEGQNKNAGEDIYKASCAVCHDAGAAGAPKIGDAGDWASRMAQGEDVLVEHAINGHQGEQGMMPARGGNPGLDDEDVQAAVQYLLNTLN